MTAKNGEKDKARGIRGKQAQVRLHADRDYLTEVRRDRFPDGSKQIRSHGADTQKIDTQWRETALGKILSQLEEIREAHLTYVNAHTERLKARLAEDEEHKQSGSRRGARPEGRRPGRRRSCRG